MFPPSSHPSLAEGRSSSERDCVADQSQQSVLPPSTPLPTPACRRWTAVGGGRCRAATPSACEAGTGRLANRGLTLASQREASHQSERGFDWISVSRAPAPQKGFSGRPNKTRNGFWETTHLRPTCHNPSHETRQLAARLAASPAATGYLVSGRKQ